jgi:hypothetical protein
MAEVFAAANNLTLQTTNSDGELIFNSAAGAEAMRIDNSGQVGIGTTSPEVRLHVKSSSSTIFELESTAANTWMKWLNGNSASPGYIGYEDGDNMTFWTSNAERMRIDSSGSVGIGTTSTTFRFNVSSASSTTTNLQSTSATSNLRLTNSGGLATIGSTSNELHFTTSTTERMRIDSSGNVGIGVASAGNLLHIHEGSSGGSWAQFTNTTTSAGASSGALVGIDSDEDFRVLQYGAKAIKLYTSTTERMRINSSGNVGIGTTSPSEKLEVSGSGATRAKVTSTGSSVQFIGSAASGGMYIDSVGAADNIIFRNTGSFTERMRIDSSGNLLVGTTSLTNRLSVAQPNAGSAIARFDHTNATASSVYGLFVYFPSAAPDDNTQYFFKGQDSSAERIIIYSDGDIVNHDNSYGAISDQKLKDQIVDSGSQWNDIKSLQVRKFKFKTDIADKGDSDNLWRLGVIAQEVEAAGMSGLVKESPDVDENNNDLGTTTKTVNYSVLYMKAVKALQEAMTRIETLEAEVAALKGE